MPFTAIRLSNTPQFNFRRRAGHAFGCASLCDDLTRGDARCLETSLRRTITKPGETNAPLLLNG